MKLFLASQDLGNFANVLQDMVGDQKRAFVISNARDYYNDEARIAQSAEKALANLAKLGIQATRLDLREYFGKKIELVRLLEQNQIGLVFSTGGNVICLSTALHASGMDDIIREGVASNQFVYGGYSAGAMVVANDLSLYQLENKPDEEQPRYFIPDVTHEVYGLAPYKQGLGLIQQYIVPHMDRADHIDAMRERLIKIKQAGAEAIQLDDADAFIANGQEAKILRGGDS